MRFLFWSSTALVAYIFIGYAGLMCLLARMKPKPVAKKGIQPSVSIVMAVHNEGSKLEAKLGNLSAITYPKELLELLVASDGSTDNTEEILRSARNTRVILCPKVGKAEALNRALAIANNEVVVFTDVRQRINSEAISELVANFADENVGCVSGELILGSSPTNEAPEISSYWNFEKLIRKWESASGSVMGATGALYAVRRSLIPRLPLDTLLDDLYIPLCVIRQGKRTVFEPNARAWDEPTEHLASEFRRKVRTLAGNVQMLVLTGWAIGNQSICFRFVSHKLLRLLAPWLMLVMFLSSWILASEPLYLALAIAQSFFYAVAMAAFTTPLSRWRPASVARVFCLLNAAAAVALFSYAQHYGNLSDLWVGKPSEPGPVEENI